MAEEKKTVSAKQVVADIRAGATDEFLMKKYGLADKGLQSLFQKLIAAKVISQSDLDRRASAVDEGEFVLIIEDEAKEVPPSSTPRKVVEQPKEEVIKPMPPSRHEETPQEKLKQVSAQAVDKAKELRGKVAENSVFGKLIEFLRVPKNAAIVRSAGVVGLIIAVAVGLAVVWTLLPIGRKGPSKEVLRFQVMWNGGLAGNGEITAIVDSENVRATVNAASEEYLNKLMELRNRIESTFSSKDFVPQKYRYELESRTHPSEVVEMSFDHKTRLISINKQEGAQWKNYSKKIDDAYDPVSAAYLLRNQKDLSQPISVLIYDGNERAVLLVSPAGVEDLRVKGGSYRATRLQLKLVRLQDKEQIGTGNLWLSDDSARVPLLLTSSSLPGGSWRFELVHVER